LPAYELVERECSGMDSDPEQGTVDMVCFEWYIEEWVVLGLGQFVDDEPRSIIVMDNASIHILEWVKHPTLYCSI
jgi:hypothetical protein